MYLKNDLRVHLKRLFKKRFNAFESAFELRFTLYIIKLLITNMLSKAI